MASNLNDNFREWFKGSVVVNSDGSPRVMYHGTSQEFDTFDPAKIKAVDTDAPFNGFWFSSDEDTSPAFHNAVSVKAVYLAIRNPAPWKVWRKVAGEVSQLARTGQIDQRSRSVNDEVRHRLSDMGYDGILFEHSPDINAEELEATGRTDFQGARGHRGWLQKAKRKETIWGPVKRQQQEIEAEIIEPNGARKPIKLDMKALVPLLVNQPGADASDFDFDTLEGTIKFANGNTMVSKLVTKEYDTQDWIDTGNEVDEIEYHDHHIGHVISYETVQEFIDSHDVVWVCFHPNQIKSVNNNGNWSRKTGNINEGIRRWMNILK